MRRSLVFASLIPAALILAGCEDGPNDTYSPANANAGNVWNNGDTPPAFDDAGTSLQQSFGGHSKTEICSGAELQDQWARMVNQPIVPPYHMAGVDISGINFDVLTVEQAENGINGMLMPVPGAPNPPTRLCQGVNLGAGSNGGDIGGSLVTAWGNNQEFYMEWAIHTHKDYFNYLNPGYLGSMDWTFQTDPGGCPQDPSYAPNGDPLDGNMHTYHWQLGKPITKDNKNFLLDWNGYGTPTANFYCGADELYRGLTSTFVHELYDNLPPGTLCRDTGRCPAFPTGNDFVHPILGFRTLSMYWDMGPPSLPQPSGSTPRDAYFFNIKYAPYSPAVANLKIDAVGPTGSLNPIGDLTPPQDCELGFGKSFGDLKTHCINVFMDQNVNQTALSKVLGNLAHDDQNYTFSIVGINQNYRDPALDIGGTRQFDIIHDNEVPADTAVAVDFTYDVRANGPILNDRYPKVDPMTMKVVPGVWRRDNHGAGAVWREYQRITQQDLTTKYHALHPSAPIRSLHDPACLFPINCSGAPACTGLGNGDCNNCSYDMATNTCVGNATCTLTAPMTCTNSCAWGFNWPPGQTPDNWRAPEGCTGFEGLMTDAYPNTFAQTGLPVNPMDPTATDPNNIWDIAYAFGNATITNGLRPGSPAILFCLDPGNYNWCGTGWDGTLQGYIGTLLDGSVQMVTQIMGKGDINSLPPGTGDYRYFFQKWSEAMAKYLESGAATHLGQNGEMVDAMGNATPVNDPVPYFGNYRLDSDNFFFDSFGGNANQSEFVSFLYADQSHDPTGFLMQMLLVGTNLQTVHFYQRLDREERAIFEAMGTADSKAGDATNNIPGNQAAWAVLKDNSGNPVLDEWGLPRKNADVFLTNLAGSPAVSGAISVATGGLVWQAPADSMGNPIPVCPMGTPPANCQAHCPPNTPTCITAFDPCNPLTPPMMVTKTAWYCATHIDPDCAGGGASWAPTDDAGNILTRPNGEPLLAGYCGIWNPNVFSLGSTAIQLVNDDITTQAQMLEQEQEVVVPNYANPYDPTSAMTPIKVLVPWLPQQNGVGYPVPYNGQNDVFVTTAELDFAGQVITPVMDYLPTTITPMTGNPYQAAQVLAYESQDFLGDAFLCYDTATGGTRAFTGRPGDLLTARMYTSVQEILTWIQTHPTAQDNCSLIVRYSPFNNFPDYITSVSNGVHLGIDQGAGAGRVTDITLFLPGTGAPAPP